MGLEVTEEVLRIVEGVLVNWEVLKISEVVLEILKVALLITCWRLFLDRSSGQ